MLLEKLQFKRIDFEVCVFEALEDLPKSLNVFLSSSGKDNAII